MFDTQSSKLKLKTDSVCFPDPLNKFLNPFDIYDEFSEALTLDDRITFDHKEIIGKTCGREICALYSHRHKYETLAPVNRGGYIPPKQEGYRCSYDLYSTKLSKFSNGISMEKNQGSGEMGQNLLLALVTVIFFCIYFIQRLSPFSSCSLIIAIIKSVPKQLEKSQFSGYSKLITQAGCFQIPATAGIYGNQDTLLGGFLGSSIPSNIIHEYNTCYTLRQPKESRCFYRLLRDYSKPSASYFAGFRSAIFANHGFQGAHPLRYYQYGKPGVMNLSVIASKIICNYINKRVGKNDIAEYLRQF